MNKGLVMLFLSIVSFVDGAWSQIEIQESQGEVVALKGQWEFYWNCLLSPEEITAGTKKPNYLGPVGYWQDQGFPVLGNGTYHTKIIFKQKTKGTLLIYFPLINTSAKIWVNGELVEEVGRVGKTADQTVSKLKSVLIPVPSGISEAELIIQASNYSYFKSGIPDSIFIGNPSSVLQLINTRRCIECIFAGSLLAMFIYHMILFALYKKGKAYLYLGLICLVVALRGLMTNGSSHLLPDLFPVIGMEYWKKIEFFAVFSLTALFPSYITSLFNSHIPKKYLLLPAYIIAGGLCCATLFTPQYIYGQALLYCHAVFIIEFIVSGFIVFNSLRTGNREARIILIGLAICFPFILFEILGGFKLLPLFSPYFVEIAVLLFLLFQAYLLASRNAKTFLRLEELNINLEKIVEEKTAELSDANDVKDTILRILSHDLKSPLNSLKGVLSLVNNRALAPQDIQELARKIESQLHKTVLVVDNVLKWTTQQADGFFFKKELINLQSAVRDTLSQFEVMASQKSIRLENKIPATSECNMDKNVLDLVIRNLVTNAIKFSHEGGIVELSSESSADSTKLIVKDSGVGISETIVQKIFEIGSHKSTLGTKSEKGTGIGLSLCKNFIDKMGGSIEVKSKEGEGSEFCVIIPAA
jgi:signal transduction histidine kinase